MNTICRDIFRAIHERKWLSIEYKNGKDEVTKYWIGIMEIDPIRKSMHVMGLHLGQYTTMSLPLSKRKKHASRQPRIIFAEKELYFFLYVSGTVITSLSVKLRQFPHGKHIVFL